MVTFDNVLMLAGDGEPTIGAPFVEGATVAGEIVAHDARSEGHRLQEAPAAEFASASAAIGRI